MFDNSSSSRIWSMMDKEFESAKSSILEHERTKNVLHPSTSSSSTSVSSISSSEPSCFHSYSSDSTHSFQYFSLHLFSSDSHPNDDVSKAPLFESAMTSIFQSICSKKTPDIAGILLSALESSHQDVREFRLCKKQISGELFTWRLLINEFRLDQFDQFDPVVLQRQFYCRSLNVVLHLLRRIEFETSFFISLDSLKSTCDESLFELVLLQVQNSACFCLALPSSDLVSLCQTYISVLLQDGVPAGIEKDSKSGLPLWMLLFALIRSGCPRELIESYRDDILRHGGAIGNDIYRLLLAFIELISHSFFIQ